MGGIFTNDWIGIASGRQSAATESIGCEGLCTCRGLVRVR